MGEKVAVDAFALRQVLNALNGPPHYIRELQVIRSLPLGMGGEDNPITILMGQYNEWATTPPEPEGNIHKDSAEKENQGDIVSWIKWFLANVRDAGDFRWVKMREAVEEIEQLRSHITPLEDRLAAQEKYLGAARNHAQKCDLIMRGYLPKIVQLTALLKRARVDVNYSFQMNADIERHQVFTPEETVAVTNSADTYQEFLDEIDAALWVPPEEGEAK